ncbi:AAA-ATPase-like protein [Gammaproteobacteria bacterium]
MKFPYGLSDFSKVLLGGYFYQDRTDRIPWLEAAGEQLLFIRPRRFGKSLLLSMLEHYYDLNRAGNFDALFGGLAIGKNPTPLHNQYFVMKWDFSLIKAQGEVREIEEAIHRHINDRIINFTGYYAKRLESRAVIDPNNAISSWESVLSAVSATPYKLYLLIDEYDNFANEVLMTRQGPGHYEALLHGEGLLKTVFKAVKAAAGGMGLDRVFITGVSPVVMSDMTSGYNVAENIYLMPEFNDLCGFTETEIETVLTRMAESGVAWSAPQALDTMRTFYNGYRFSEDAEESIYNPTLSLYFLKYLQHYGRYPRQILDDNLAMDRNKLEYISRLPHGEAVLIEALSSDTALMVPQLARRFGVQDMLKPVKDQVFMASLLYYFGVVTLAGRGGLDRLVLKIPNLVARALYVESLQDLWLPTYEDRELLQNNAEALYRDGDLQPLCDFIERRYYQVLSNRDYRWSNELMVKMAFLTLLFNDRLYMMVSEIETGHGYADLSLIVRPDKRHTQALDLLLEFKYLGLDDLSMNGKAVRETPRDELAVLPVVVAKLDEADVQARRYGTTLIERYRLGDLRAFSVVSLGLERLVWRRVAALEASPLTDPDSS